MIELGVRLAAQGDRVNMNIWGERKFWIWFGSRISDGCVCEISKPKVSYLGLVRVRVDIWKISVLKIWLDGPLVLGFEHAGINIKDRLSCIPQKLCIVGVEMLWVCLEDTFYFTSQQHLMQSKENNFCPRATSWLADLFGLCWNVLCRSILLLLRGLDVGIAWYLHCHQLFVGYRHGALLSSGFFSFPWLHLEIFCVFFSWTWHQVLLKAAVLCAFWAEEVSRLEGSQMFERSVFGIWTCLKSGVSSQINMFCGLGQHPKTFVETTLSIFWLCFGLQCELCFYRKRIPRISSTIGAKVALRTLVRCCVAGPMRWFCQSGRNEFCSHHSKESARRAPEIHSASDSERKHFPDTKVKSFSCPPKEKET